MRLIDADALYEKLQKDSTYDLDCMDSELREIIDNQPTAFDTEKVVEQLEKEGQKMSEAMKVIKEECEKHIMCRHCALYGDEGCIVEPCPSDWKINDNACIDELLKGEEG